MSLTTAQQLRLQQTPVQFRAQKRNNYLQQNAQRQGNINPGMQRSLNRAGFGNTPRFNGFVRGPTNPNVTRPTQGPQQTRGTQILLQPRPTIAAQEQGSTVIGEISIQNNKLYQFVQTIHPRTIAGLRPYTDMYQEWSASSIRFRFVSTAPTTASGTIVIAFLANNDATPNTIASAMCIPNAVVTSVHETSPFVTAPVNKLQEHWYHNMPYDGNNQELRHPGWFAVLAVSPNTQAVGYIQVQYNIKFRIKKTQSAGNVREARHIDIQAPTHILSTGESREEHVALHNYHPDPSNPPTIGDDASLLTAGAMALPDADATMTDPIRERIRAAVLRIARHPPPLTHTQMQSIYALPSTTYDTVAKVEAYLRTLNFNTWRLSYVFQSPGNRALMNAHLRNRIALVRGIHPSTESAQNRLQHLQNNRPSVWFTE